VFDVAKNFVPPQYQGIVSGVDNIMKSQGMSLVGGAASSSKKKGGNIMSRNDFTNY